MQSDVDIKSIITRRAELRFSTSAALFVHMKITEEEFRSELRSNPILAAGLSCNYGGQLAEGEPGDRALQEIDYRRRGARSHTQSRSDAQGADCHAAANPPEMITWPEFVGAFLPLAQWEWGEGALRHRSEGGGGNGDFSSGHGRWEAGLLPDVDDDEIELLRVAFAVRTSGVRGRDEPGVATLAELRAASAELDGEEPLEEPIRKAIKVRQYASTTRKADPVRVMSQTGVRLPGKILRTCDTINLRPLLNGGVPFSL